MSNFKNNFDFLPEPIPITHHQWEINTIQLVCVSCKTYNHAPFIQDTIEGFLMQKTTFPVRIVIFDDCSTDGTSEIIQEYQERYPHLFHITRPPFNTWKHPQRREYGKPFREARGVAKYIAMCEGDDYWTDPLKLQKQVDFLEANPDYGMVFTRFKTFNQDSGEYNDDKNSKYFEEDKAHIDWNFEIFEKGWHIGTQTVLFRKDLSEIDASKYKYYRDVYLYTELLLQKKGACLSDFCAVYRIHDRGIYNSLNALKTARIGKLCYEELYNKNKQITPLKNKYKNFHKRYIVKLTERKMRYSALKELIAYYLNFRDFDFTKKQLKVILKGGN